MSTDRELLELAAKALGWRWSMADVCWYDDQTGTWTKTWDPLTSDADALRLAVKLGLGVSVEYQIGSTVVLWGPPTGTARESHGTDPYAATRRAIVRAAAELGRTT